MTKLPQSLHPHFIPRSPYMLGLLCYVHSVGWLRRLDWVRQDMEGDREEQVRSLSAIIMDLTWLASTLRGLPRMAGHFPSWYRLIFPHLRTFRLRRSVRGVDDRANVACVGIMVPILRSPARILLTKRTGHPENMQNRYQSESSEARHWPRRLDCWPTR